MYKTIISLIIFMLGLYYIFNFDNKEKETYKKMQLENFVHGNDHEHGHTTEHNTEHSNKDSDKQESSGKYKCPDLLIQKGNAYYLYNTKLAPVPGVNPVVFSCLEDYSEFLQWQRSQNIRCPVLYLRESYDTQGEQTYNIHPSPTDLQGGLNKQIIVDGKPNMIKLNANSNNDPLNHEQLQQFSKLLDASRTDPSYNNNMYAGFDKDNLYIGLETPLDKMYYEHDNLSTNPMDPNWGGREYTQDTFKTTPSTNINMLKFKRDMINNNNTDITNRVKEIVIIDNWGND